MKESIVEKAKRTVKERHQPEVDANRARVIEKIKTMTITALITGIVTYYLVSHQLI